MRFTAALRCCIQSSVLKNGMNLKYLRKLKQISLAEVLFSQNYSSPCNLSAILSNLLLAVKIKKNEMQSDFCYKIKTDNNCILDIKAFKLLILNICSNSKNIVIYSLNGKIIIKSDGKIKKHSRLLANKLDGCVYNEIKTNSSFAVIPFTATDKNANTIGYKSVEEYISDPFSVVNIFIN